MGFKLTKKELETLGGRFAEMLLFGGEANPKKLSGLANRKDWKKAESYEKNKRLLTLRGKQKLLCWNADTIKRLWKGKQKNLFATKEQRT